ncbi:uncharacterized protein [Halyomorpha halys]|uniref:uncharacterized protein isoform X2 n=1 Tax=Halyomorpha halys TaxID=286706 RepID=UPI0006D4C92B|nr:uncharacterized protein LOC106677137 isoform X2 [Halyomorpha halys]
MTNSFGRTNSLTEEPLPILEELTRFLKFYLDPGEAKRIQKIAKYHVNHPDEDIKGFVKDVLNTLSETLQLDRRGLIEATQKLIQVYNERMKKAEDSDPVCSNISVCGSIRETAAKDLIEGLDAIIPEAKRSDLKVRASHVLKEDLDDFVNGFQEDLVIFMEEREIEITSNLKAKLNVFKNELVELSKQLRMMVK